MSTSSRIYVVTDLDSDPVVHRLVRAPTRAQAIAHVTAPRFIADVATQDTLVEQMAAGVKVETAGEQTPPKE